VTSKTVSIIATAVLLAAFIALLLRHGIIAAGPVSGTLEIAPLLLVLWARLTFGWRSYHFAGNSTRGL
jgi:hypothetical protein